MFFCEYLGGIHVFFCFFRGRFEFDIDLKTPVWFCKIIPDQRIGRKLVIFWSAIKGSNQTNQDEGCLFQFVVPKNMNNLNDNSIMIHQYDPLLCLYVFFVFPFVGSPIFVYHSHDSTAGQGVSLPSWYRTLQGQINRRVPQTSKVFLRCERPWSFGHPVAWVIYFYI